MKLWVMGGQCDDYYECVPSDRCDSCELRFKCWTSASFECSPKHSKTRRNDLTSHEFDMFMYMLHRK